MYQRTVLSKKANIRRKCANPLFEKWLMEWRDEAKAKGSRLENHFTYAITALRKYPLLLKTGRDCILLQHFGTKLCAMLDRKLKSYNDGRENAHRSNTELVDNCDEAEDDDAQRKSKSPEGDATTCKPVRCRESAEKKLRKLTSLTLRKRAHSMSSSDSNAPSSPTVEVLNIDEEVEKPVTTELSVQAGNSVNSQLLRNGAHSGENPIIDEFCILPNNFDILLLVDTHETGGGKVKSKDDATKSELDRLATPYEIRHLKVGDFAWIARCKDTGRELILPYILERKRIDDLASSIKDGRFHEQKFRLKKSGIPNVIYMVENHGNNQHLGIPLASLLQASTNSLVQDGFMVKFTNSHRDSMRYLSILTSLIYKSYKEKHLIGIEKENLETAGVPSHKVPLMKFGQFNKAASKVKTFKVKEMFVRQLLQLKGLSLEKALAIIERYPTPVCLVKAFRDAGNEAENLLAMIRVGAQNRQLGPALRHGSHVRAVKILLPSVLDGSYFGQTKRKTLSIVQQIRRCYFSFFRNISRLKKNWKSANQLSLSHS